MLKRETGNLTTILENDYANTYINLKAGQKKLS